MWFNFADSKIFGTLRPQRLPFWKYYPRRLNKIKDKPCLDVLKRWFWDQASHSFSRAGRESGTTWGPFIKKSSKVNVNMVIPPTMAILSWNKARENYLVSERSSLSIDSMNNFSLVHMVRRQIAAWWAVAWKRFNSGILIQPAMSTPCAKGLKTGRVVGSCDSAQGQINVLEDDTLSGPCARPLTQPVIKVWLHLIYELGQRHG